MLKITESNKRNWLYIISGLFLILMSYFIVKEKYWLSAAVPGFLILAYLYVYRLDQVVLLTAFLTPLAVKLSDMDMGVSISLPTEPLLFGILVVFLIKALFENSYDIRILKHPITIALFINLAWMFFTTVTSELPFVSLKYFISRLWFVVPFFFVGVMLFKDVKNLKRFVWLYVAALIIVIVRTTYIHAINGFTAQVAHWAVRPFYNDHTAYGAIIAFFLPITVGFTLYKENSIRYRWMAFSASAVLFVALILSNSRAAWLSIVVAIGIFVILKLKIKFRYIFGIFAVFVVLFFSFQTQIVDTLERNKQDSSADIVEQIQSMYNISTDASNLERINRWQSAIRLFKERPFLGWGPGTYQFVYAPYQMSKEKTIISTNFGDMGNAHSEYLGPLAESGVLGTFTVLILIIVVLNRALRLYKYSDNKEVRFLSLIAMLSLSTYYFHGLLNNFLDSDKLSVPVWGIIALVVALDVFHNKKGKNISETTQS
ncbi:MAG: O-antigen ligase family protein [Bacteroidota bacterium]|nr:O-antigen ligase family protein [Bacteroidota bacterium]